MILIRDALSPSLLEEVLVESKEKASQSVWMVSDLAWDEDVKTFSSGTCVHTPVSKGLEVLILEELKDVLPRCKTYSTMHYYWLKNSSIPSHTDRGNNRVFGCTIYLNQMWKPEYGGLFLYKEKNNLKVITPEYNSLVINDEYESHMVTPINPYTPYPRVTLQIWGLN